MKKTIRIITVLAGIASATAFGSHFAQADQGKRCCDGCAQQRHHGHDFKSQRLEKMSAKLGLSEQQKVQMKATLEQNREQAKPIFEKLMTEKRALRTLVQADKTDEAAIRTQAAKLATVEGDMAIHRAHMAKQIRAILTPEQLEKFKAMKKEKGEKFNKFRGHHGKRMNKPGLDL
jgi:periplasmic protein CpxP/Spy